MPDATSLREDLDRLQAEQAQADGKVSEAEAAVVRLGVEADGATVRLRDEQRRAAGWVGLAGAVLREQLEVVVASTTRHLFSGYRRTTSWMPFSDPPRGTVEYLMSWTFAQLRRLLS